MQAKGHHDGWHRRQANRSVGLGHCLALSLCHHAPLRILIDSRLTPQIDGGVEQVIEGLADGFAAQLDRDMDITFLTRHPAPPSLLGRRSSSLAVREVQPSSRRRSTVRRIVGQMPLAHAAHRLIAGGGVLALQDALVGEDDFDVVHLAVQNGFRPSVPYVYSPYDLQHLHHPEFFTPGERKARERTYGPLASGASAVVVHTRWSARDACARLRVPPTRVLVVPLGVRPAQPADPGQDARARAVLGIATGDYALYPAQTWQHKNHLRLLECIAQLRDGGLPIRVVCTGNQDQHFPRIQHQIDRLGLSALVHFTGFVRSSDLRSLYAGARCLIFPSLFEGWGMPVFDALASGLPVAATNCCGLGEVLGDAAETFDPANVSDMSASLRRLWTDEARRAAVVRAGHRLASTLTWDHTCRTLSAIYREIADAPPLDGDIDLLRRASSWREPSKPKVD